MHTTLPMSVFYVLLFVGLVHAIFDEDVSKSGEQKKVKSHSELLDEIMKASVEEPRAERVRGGSERPNLDLSGTLLSS